MKKNLLSWLFVLAVLVLCVSLVPTKTQAASESDLTFTLNEDGNSYSITDCDWDATGELIIPSTYNGKSVTAIGLEAFSYCSKLTSVTIPDSVTSIGEYAFYYCTRLASVTIGNGVTSIGNSAFRDCNKLTSVTIPDSVTTIGSAAFYYCGNLDSVFMGSGITSIGSSAFYGSSSLTNVYMKDIAAWCEISFADKYANPLLYASKLYVNGELLTELIIPDSVTTIGEFAFYDCDNITSVTISDSVTTIGGYAFAYCYRLTSVTIGDSVTTIGPSAFDNCSNLVGVVLPKSLTEIGYYGFSNCRNLAEVHYKGTADDSEEITFRSDNAPLIKANWHYEVTDAVANGQNCYYCPECDKYFLADGTQIVPVFSGDFTGDDKVNNEDVIYLLWHTMFPESYPIETSADFTEDGKVNSEDVIYLLWHTMFPESYPLTEKKKEILA